ncbi:MAG: hypothetical protein UMU75_03025 [Halomonas sp.]|nr:hypothetical protein [Halomonas sp.]
MLDWVKQYSTAIVALANIGNFLLWGVFLHVMLQGFLRQRRPSLIINRSSKQGLDARCVIGNMGSATVYIMQVEVSLWVGDEYRRLDATELGRHHDTEQADDDSLAGETFQGTLKAGTHFHIGTFRSLIDTLALEGDSDRCRLRIELIALHATDDIPIGAERTFTLTGEELAPVEGATRQRRSYLQRRRLRKRLLSAGPNPA